MVVATGARVVVVVVAIDRARSRYRARARRGDGGALLTRSRFARGWVAPRTRVAPDTARDLASLMERLARTSPSVCVRCVDGRMFRIHTPPPPSLPFERQRSQKVVLALDPAHLLRNVKVECTQRLGIKEVRPSSPCRARRAGRCRDARGVANTPRAPILAVPRARRAVL